MDPPTARALVRLRYALEHALALARDSSEPGAHIAIVALDGTVENALWLTARSYGAQVKQMASRQELLNRVRDALANAGRTWRPAGGPGVQQLNRARNDAQHAAVQFDAAQLPDWSAAARAFIDSILSAAFERPLSEVALADAVRDPHLADLLRRAEQAIDQSQPGVDAFALIGDAFDDARRRWREQQGHVFGGWLPGGPASQASLPALGMLDTAISQDDRLTDFLEVVPFAGDLGEYSCFLSARRQQQQAAWTPDVDETRRALIFVSGWIVRW